jgi:hypothetical protein
MEGLKLDPSNLDIQNAYRYNSSYRFSYVIFTTLERLLEMAFDIYISTPSLCNQMKHVSKIVVLVRFVMIYCWCKVWTYDLCGHSFAQDCKVDILSRTQSIFKGFLIADFFSGRQKRQWSRIILLDKVSSHSSRVGRVTCLFHMFVVLIRGKWYALMLPEMSFCLSDMLAYRRCFWTVPAPVFLPHSTRRSPFATKELYF